MTRTTPKSTTEQTAPSGPETAGQTAEKSEPAVAQITERQMRHLHALLRDHGITGDRAVHDYLSVAVGREVESRRDLTGVEAATLIRDLENAPVRTGTVREGLAALRAEFPPEAVGKLPRSTCKACSDLKYQACENHRWVSRCGECHGNHTSATMHIDFVGHADVTARLLEVDPEWSWRPFTAEEVTALPPKFRDAGLWIQLTVLGITRPGFGDADGKSGGNAVKEAIGDALRNSAMRFGVALSLWAKGDRDWAHSEKDDPNPPMDPPPARETPPPAAARPPVAPPPTTTDPIELGMTAELIADLERLAETQRDDAGRPRDLEWITLKFRNENGALPVDALYTLAPTPLAELVDKWRAHLGESVPV